jgi:hypothetical protein
VKEVHGSDGYVSCWYCNSDSESSGSDSYVSCWYCYSAHESSGSDGYVSCWYCNSDSESSGSDGYVSCWYCNSDRERSGNDRKDNVSCTYLTVKKAIFKLYNCQNGSEMPLLRDDKNPRIHIIVTWWSS